MSTDALTLLKQLASGPRPVGGAAASPTPLGAVAAGEFASLLKKAQSGELASSRPVTIDRDAKVALTDDQLAQISLSADKAEAAGIRTALVLLDGRAVKLDVGNRVITGPADLGAGVLSGFDGLINLSPKLLEAGAAPAVIPVPPLGAPGPTLAALLERREDRPAAAA